MNIYNFFLSYNAFFTLSSELDVFANVRNKALTIKTVGFTFDPVTAL
jgi:hypothetical protein